MTLSGRWRAVLWEYNHLSIWSRKSGSQCCSSEWEAESSIIWVIICLFGLRKVVAYTVAPSERQMESIIIRIYLFLSIWYKVRRPSERQMASSIYYRLSSASHWDLHHKLILYLTPNWYILIILLSICLSLEATA